MREVVHCQYIILGHFLQLIEPNCRHEVGWFYIIVDSGVQIIAIACSLHAVADYVYS